MEGVDLVALVREFGTLGAITLGLLWAAAITLIMAWKGTWPWKRRRRRGREDDSVV